MVDRSILYRIRAGLQGGYTAVAQEVQLLASYAGVLSGTSDSESAFQRIDGTGVGAAIFRFTGAYSAQASNISEWFGGRQQVRLRCTDNGGISPVTFDLPGTSALNTAFDQLVSRGLDEQLRFIIEYTGPQTTFLNVRPRISPSPQIQGITNIVVRSGVAATIEITRSSGTISDYIFVAIGGIGGDTGSAFDSLKLVNPVTAVWNASTNGVLPTTGVVKGNAYLVANAPSDGSGRFGEVMYDNDWVVWQGETFSSWSAEPHQWFVLPAHEVRRITALENDFLRTIQTTPVSDRNTVVRGANYADTAGEIRLKIYPTAADYNAADLNTTGLIDAYTNVADQEGFLAIRLTGTQATLASVLPTLYVYSEDSSGNFLRLLNLDSDFAHQGDFTSESDYLSLESIHYGANNTLRIYVGNVLDRYNTPDLDIIESQLSTVVQQKLNRQDGGSAIDGQRLQTVENKLAVLYPLTPDVHKLTEFAEVFDPDRTVEGVTVTAGYTLMADFRDAATRYEQTGVTYDDTGTNIVVYTGLGNDLHRCFGFKVTAPSNKTLLTIFNGTEEIPYIDMTAAGNFRVNNFRHARQDGDVVRNEVHFFNRIEGDELLNPGEVNVSTFQIQNFPTGATEVSRFLGFDIELVASDGAELGGHLVTVPLPDTNVAQDRLTTSGSLSPIGVYAHYGTVNFTVSYTIRVDGANLEVDFRLVNITSGFNARIASVDTTLNYTAAATTTRTDNFIILQDFGSNYTFTGEAEMLCAFHPLPDGNSMEVVPVVREADGTVVQLNDSTTVSPEGGFSKIQIPDDIDFRTFLPDHFLRHIDLAHLATRANVQWVYGLALLGAISDRQITQEIDFTQGIILNSPNGTKYRVTVTNAGAVSTEVVT